MVQCPLSLEHAVCGFRSALCSDIVDRSHDPNPAAPNREVEAECKALFFLDRFLAAPQAHLFNARYCKNDGVPPKQKTFVATAGNNKYNHYPR